jgi:hypothetical protein
MHLLYCIVSCLIVLWVLIFIDAKRTKAHEKEEGWTDFVGGKIKKFPKPPVIERHEKEAYFPELVEEQNN